MKRRLQANTIAPCESVSRRMKNTRDHNDGERTVRSILFRRGMRFRVNMTIPNLRTRPDITFPRLKVAIYLDGCFWHGCPDHGTMPTANREYWAQKIAENAARDRRVSDRLQTAGWNVLRLWVHNPPDKIADRIQAFVASLTPESCSAE